VQPGVQNRREENRKRHTQKNSPDGFGEELSEGDL
jgi:hypothetical protein